jgi:predicted nucleic acid-binding protein
MPSSYYSKLIISDTSCLIALTNIRRLDLLKELCKVVYITPEVAAEYGEALPDWIQVIPVKDALKVQTINNDLDLGESTAIALALETQNSLLILDDGKARRFAKNIGLTMTGTLGLLITAYKAGILPDFNIVIEKLRKHNFRIPANIDKYLS